MLLPQEIYATFAGTIDVQAAHRFFQAFALAINGGVKKVHLLIQSSGGTVGDGVAIYNFLRNLPIEILTYNIGSVSSIAVIIFLAGQKRICSQYATFTIHKTTFPPQASIIAEMMRAYAGAAELDDENTEAILRAHINLPDDRWTLMQRHQVTISAQEAVQFALVHEISHFAPPLSFQLYNI